MEGINIREIVGQNNWLVKLDLYFTVLIQEQQPEVSVFYGEPGLGLIYMSLVSSFMYSSRFLSQSLAPIRSSEVPYYYIDDRHKSLHGCCKGLIPPEVDLFTSCLLTI